MRVILIRHGETEENAARIIQGHLPGRLSRRGREQARLLGLHFKDHEIDRVYCSDLARARDTAGQIIQHHPGVPVFYLPDLRERYLGPWQGKRGADLDRGVILATPDVENDQEIEERAHRLMTRVRTDQAERSGTPSVVLIGHGGINYVLTALLLGRERGEELGAMSNTAYSVFDIAEGKETTLVAHNQTDHLESMNE